MQTIQKDYHQLALQKVQELWEIPRTGQGTALK
jgi:hypothetical protein